jgi:hypothetical protein
MDEIREVKGPNHKALCLLFSEMRKHWEILSSKLKVCLVLSEAHSGHRDARLEAGRSIGRLLK